MSDADRYLSRLDELEGKKDKSETIKRFREAYAKKVKRSDFHKPTLYSEAHELAGNINTIEKYLRRTDRARTNEDVRVLARATMESAKEDSYIGGAIYAANMYSALGKNHIALSKLMAVVEKAAKEGKAKPQDLADVRYFIKTTQSKQSSSTGLESRVGIFVAFLLGGVVLSLTSLNATGNAVGTLGTTQGLAGIFLFILGLAGIAFGLKK